MIYGAEQAMIEKNPMKRLALKWVGTTHLGDRSRNHYLVRALRRITLPNAPHVFNAGCSNGAHSFYLARLFPAWRITGMDIDGKKVEQAGEIARKIKAQNLHFQRGDLKTISFNGLFDLIFSMHVLTFIREDLKVLNRFYRALKQGGYLILSVPTPPIVPRLPWLRRGSLPCRDERIGYTNEEISQKIKKVGFSLIALCNPAGLLGQITWEISSALEGKKLLRIFIHPFLILFVDFDHLIENKAPFPKGTDCLVIAQK